MEALRARFDALAALHGWSLRRLQELEDAAGATATALPRPLSASSFLSDVDGEDWSVTPRQQPDSPEAGMLPPRLSAAIGSAVTVRRRSRRSSRVAPLVLDEGVAGEAGAAASDSVGGSGSQWLSPLEGAVLDSGSPLPPRRASRGGGGGRGGPALDIGDDEEPEGGLDGRAGDDVLETSLRRLSVSRGADNQGRVEHAPQSSPPARHDAAAASPAFLSHRWSPAPSPDDHPFPFQDDGDDAFFGTPRLSSRVSLGGTLYKGYRLSTACVEECASPVMESGSGSGGGRKSSSGGGVDSGGGSGVGDASVLVLAADEEGAVLASPPPLEALHDEEEEEERPRVYRRAAAQDSADEVEDDEDEEDIVIAAPRRGGATAAAVSQPAAVDADDDEEGEEDVVLAPRRRLPPATAAAARCSSKDDDEEDIPVAPRRNAPAVAAASVSSSSGEEEYGGSKQWRRWASGSVKPSASSSWGFDDDDNSSTKYTNSSRPGVRSYRERHPDASTYEAFGGLASPIFKRARPPSSPTSAAVLARASDFEHDEEPSPVPAPVPAPAPAPVRAPAPKPRVKVRAAPPAAAAPAAAAALSSPGRLRDGDRHPVTGRIVILEELEAAAASSSGLRWGIGGSATSSSSSSSSSSHFFKSTAQRDALTAALFTEYRETVLGCKLPSDLLIEWNPRLLRTAGLTYTSLVRVADPAAPGGYRVDHRARIELSTKVLDTPLKLATTLLHELCHAAAWVVDGVNKPPHGACFKVWAAAATRAYPGRAVTTCHSFEVHHKYQYACADAVSCGTTYGRHSKSIDLERHRCGKCGGKLVFLGTFRPDGTPTRKRGKGGEEEGDVSLLSPAGTPGRGGQRSTPDWLRGEGRLEEEDGGTAGSRASTGPGSSRPAGSRTPGTPSAYQAFLAQHRPAVVAANPGVPPSQVLTLLAAMWQQHKAAAGKGGASPARRLGEALLPSSSSSDGEGGGGGGGASQPWSSSSSSSAAAAIDLLDSDEDSL